MFCCCVLQCLYMYLLCVLHTGWQVIWNVSSLCIVFLRWCCKYENQLSPICVELLLYQKEQWFCFLCNFKHFVDLIGEKQELVESRVIRLNIKIEICVYYIHDDASQIWYYVKLKRSIFIIVVIQANSFTIVYKIWNLLLSSNVHVVFLTGSVCRPSSAKMTSRY